MKKITFFLATFLVAIMVLSGDFWGNMKGMVYSNCQTQSPKIRVLIVSDKPGVTLEVTGKHQIYDPHSKQHLGKRFVGKKKYLEATNTGLKWNEEFPGVYQLHIVPEGPDSAILIDGLEYKGSIFIYDISGALSIVNCVNAEEYIEGILPEKYTEPLHQETLSAIAIAARTEAFYMAQHPANQFWTVDGKDVGYVGKTKRPPGAVECAIHYTAGMILSKTGTYEGKITPFPAEWTDEAGTSENKENFSHISIKEAEELGKRGEHAAQILNKAFPATHIECLR